MKWYLLGILPYLLNESYVAGKFRGKWYFKRFAKWSIEWIWFWLIMAGNLWFAFGLFVEFIKWLTINFPLN